MEDVADRNLVSAWAPVATMCALVLAVSSIPGGAVPVPKGTWDFDKLMHATEYALLGALLTRALVLSGVTGWHAFLAAVVVTAVFGGLDEWYQGFTPGRFSSRWDALADLCGGIVGALGVTIWRSYGRTRARPPS